jgi:hypothetical protein
MDRKLNMILIAVCIVALATAWGFSAETPETAVAVAIGMANSETQTASLQLPVTAEVREPVKKVAKRVWGMVPCATCPSGFRYDWIDEAPEPIDEAKAEAVVEKMSKGTLTNEELAKLEAEVPAKTIRKVLEQRWDIASCGMACISHGSKLYNVYADGTVEPAPDQPDSAPEEGVHSGSGGSRLRFRGRR